MTGTEGKLTGCHFPRGCEHSASHNHVSDSGALSLSIEPVNYPLNAVSPSTAEEVRPSTPRQQQYMLWNARSMGKSFLQQLWGGALAESNGSAGAHRMDLTEGRGHEGARLPGCSSPQSSPSERPTVVCSLSILVLRLTLSVQRASSRAACSHPPQWPWSLLCQLFWSLTLNWACRLSCHPLSPHPSLSLSLRSHLVMVCL